MKNTEVADRIKRRVANYFRRKRRVSFYEVGLNKGGRLRADVLVLAMTGHIVVVEVKSSVSDFRTDKKLLHYRPYCDQLYIALNREVYAKVKSEIPEGVGVFIFNPDDGRTAPKVLRAKNVGVDEEVRKNIVIRAAFRNSDNTNRKNRGQQ
jgi:hypothetical protein